MSSQPAPSLHAFTLEDDRGGRVTFPTGRYALLCFVKEDCPTCNTALPLLDRLFTRLAGHIDILVAGQTREGNALLARHHGLKVPLLDDSELLVSFRHDVDIVPTLILSDASGTQVRRLEGFVRDDWQALVEEAVRLAGAPASEIDWDAYPFWRPGCGSLSADPGHAARLESLVSGKPVRAREILVGAHDDEIEFLYEQEYSDGLPLVPPTRERVAAMLAGTARSPDETIATVPPNMGIATVEKIAINAVMAGCKPGYLPVVIAALEAVCTDEFNIHGVMATTMGAAPVLVVNGPIRHRIGMNDGMGALGQGNRANATIGRALRLVLRNIGGARPGGTERSTLGNPMKFTMCFAEREERSPFPPLHVERGFAPGDSVVTVFAMTSGPTLIVDQTSREAAQLAGSIGLCLEAVHHPRARFAADTLLVLCPEHCDTLRRGAFTKADVRRRIQEVTAVPMASLARDDLSGVGMDPARIEAMDPAARAQRLPKFRREEDIHIVVAGGDAGKFSAAFHGWVTGAVGSEPVSRKIEGEAQ